MVGRGGPSRGLCGCGIMALASYFRKPLALQATEEDEEALAEDRTFQVAKRLAHKLEVSWCCDEPCLRSPNMRSL